MGDDGNRAEDMLEAAIARIEATSAKMDRVYGDCADGRLSMNARTGSGSLRDIVRFVTE
jgi:CRISPR system Cascade subunit CasC